MVPVIIILDDKDRHGLGCRCGLCNTNGHSFGVSIYNATGVDTEDEDARDDLLHDPDRKVTIVYAPSEQAADQGARRYCDRFNYRIEE
jgi:hypothetical protein